MKITRRTVVQSIIGGLGLAQATPQSSNEWRYDYNRAFRLPTVYEGVAYVVGGNGALHAIDVDSGTREWIYDHRSAYLEHEVTVVDRRCFVSDYGARRNESGIRIIGVDSGEILETLPVAIEETDVKPGPPLVYNGICYVQTTEALIAIDYLNKEMLWSDKRFSRPAGSPQLPAIGGDTVVAQSGGAIHAFDALMGEHQWTAPHNPSSNSRAPVIENEEVFVSLNGGLVCVDLATGDTRWRYQSGAIGYRPAHVPVVYDNTVFINGARRTGVWARDGVVEAIDVSGGEPRRRWIVKHGLNMSGAGTIAANTLFIGSEGGGALLAIDIETGEVQPVHNDETQYKSVILGAGHLFNGMSELIAIELEDIEDEYGSRGFRASNAHHDGWAERAALKVASLELNTTPADPRIGNELEISVTAQLESGIEANVTNDSTLDVNAVGSVDENGTIRVEDSGEMTVAATFGGQTTNRTISVPAEEPDDDGAEDDDDALGGGIITVATAIGGAAYWFSRRSGATQ